MKSSKGADADAKTIPFHTARKLVDIRMFPWETRSMLSLRASVFLFLACAASAFSEDKRPTGKFLFQPMLIWGDSEVTRQGTGYLLKHGTSYFGITSVHFLNFEANGLFEAIWVDVNTNAPVIGFRDSLGKPARTEIERKPDIAFDFLVMPAANLPQGYAAVELESERKYEPGTKLWFPNKKSSEKTGYEWVNAEVTSDEGHVITVKLLQKVKLQSQSGTPFINEKSGRAIGMLMGGQGDEIYLCPSRGIVAHLEKEKAVVPLMQSIKK